MSRILLAFPKPFALTEGGSPLTFIRISLLKISRKPQLKIIFKKL